MGSFQSLPLGKAESPAEAGLSQPDIEMTGGVR